MLNYLNRNFSLVLGLLLLFTFILTWISFSLIVDFNDAKPLSFRPVQAPSIDHWLGTDRMGKDVLTSIVIGTPQTIQIGVVAGGIGITLGVIFGFVAGFFWRYCRLFH
jgi:peptide/nickel transport system permease protein